MQENLTAARPYAEAVFELAREDNALGPWSESLQVLAHTVAHEDMAHLIKDPRVPEADLEALIVDIGGHRLIAKAKNLIRLLINNQRLAIAPAIAEVFERLRAEVENVVSVEVCSAYPLDREQQDTIAGAVSKRFGKGVEVSTTTDQSLIGGAVIKVGDHVIDASIRGRLNQLANDLV
jgi:F-type H+-transporting ATPase subunit delta